MVKSAWGHCWIPGVERLNFQKKHFPGSGEIENFRKNISRCGEIEQFRKLFPWCGEIKWPRKAFSGWRDCEIESFRKVFPWGAHIEHEKENIFWVWRDWIFTKTILLLSKCLGQVWKFSFMGLRGAFGAEMSNRALRPEKKTLLNHALKPQNYEFWESQLIILIQDNSKLRKTFEKWKYCPKFNILFSNWESQLNSVFFLFLMKKLEFLVNKFSFVGFEKIGNSQLYWKIWEIWRWTQKVKCCV